MISLKARRVGTAHRRIAISTGPLVGSAHPTSHLHFDLKPLPFLAANERLGLLVTNDLLFLRIPLELTSQANGDAGQVAR